VAVTLRSLDPTGRAIRLLVAGFIAAISLIDIAAADPTGEWLVANGKAKIRIDRCDGALWGLVSWEKEAGTDSNNPNSALRSRPTLGLHILVAMRPTKSNLWEGEIYNPENGKTYKSRLSMTSSDLLRVEGCMLGFLCGGENWTRVSEPARAAVPQAVRRDTKSEPAAVGSACPGTATPRGAP